MMSSISLTANLSCQQPQVLFRSATAQPVKCTRRAAKPAGPFLLMVFHQYFALSFTFNRLEDIDCVAGCAMFARFFHVESE